MHFTLLLHLLLHNIGVEGRLLEVEFIDRLDELPILGFEGRLQGGDIVHEVRVEELSRDPLQALEGLLR
jgi:hypothetical protein